MSAKRRICVIGAGTAGLVALKYALEYDFETTCYEQAQQLGGLWVYSDNVEEARSENEVISSMYYDLRTNLPKEVMGYPDLPYPNNTEESFISSPEVLHYMNLYADQFGLRPHIKCQHTVISVRPWNGNQWEITVKDNLKDNLTVSHFDFVFVCNGHFTVPCYPQTKGRDIFKGKQLHSHLFRKAEQFKDQTVLVIGGGNSAIDITAIVRKHAKCVFISHHLKKELSIKFMTNVQQKCDVKYFTENGAVFTDDSSEEFDAIIYCTGYNYTFPFLSEECGIEVVDGAFVRPVWKHIINIQHPTMAFIGLLSNLVPSHTFDLQVRFAMTYFTGKQNFPSTDEMRADLAEDVKQRRERGLTNRKAHLMGETYRDVYFEDIAKVAGIENIKPVMRRINDECSATRMQTLETYRNMAYRIIDDERFDKVPIVRKSD